MWPSRVQWTCSPKSVAHFDTTCEALRLSLETDRITKQGPQIMTTFNTSKTTGRVVFKPTQVQLSAWQNVGYKRQRQNDPTTSKLYSHQYCLAKTNWLTRSLFWPRVCKLYIVYCTLYILHLLAWSTKTCLLSTKKLCFNLYGRQTN